MCNDPLINLCQLLSILKILRSRRKLHHLRLPLVESVTRTIEAIPIPREMQRSISTLRLKPSDPNQPRNRQLRRLLRLRKLVQYLKLALQSSRTRQTYHQPLPCRLNPNTCLHRHPVVHRPRSENHWFVRHPALRSQAFPVAFMIRMLRQHHLRDAE